MTRKGLRATVIIAVSALVLIMILLRVFHIFPPTAKTEGTIGNVEKVDRFRGKAMSVEDLKVDNPDVNRVIQSAEFQNLLNDDVARALIFEAANFKQIAAAIEVAKILDYAADGAKQFLASEKNVEAIDHNAQVQKFIDANGKPVGFTDFHSLVSDPGFQALVKDKQFGLTAQAQEEIFGSQYSKLAEVGIADYASKVLKASDFDAADFNAADAQASDFEASDFDAADAQASDFEASDFDAADAQASDFDAADAKASDFDAADFNAADAKASDFDAADFEATGFEALVTKLTATLPALPVGVRDFLESADFQEIARNTAFQQLVYSADFQSRIETDFGVD